MAWLFGGMSQATKSELDQKQIQSQQYVNDACGRVLAELEELIRIEYPKYEGHHRQYVGGANQSRIKRMANVEMFLKAFKIYFKDNQDAKSAKVHVVTVPYPGDHVMKELQSAYHGVTDPTLRKILHHVIKGFQNGDLSPFPAHLSEEVLSSRERTDQIHDMINNRQDTIARLHYEGQQLTATIDGNLKKDIDRTGQQKIPQQPLVDTKLLGPRREHDPR